MSQQKVHLMFDGPNVGACGILGKITKDPSEVTCKICRKTKEFRYSRHKQHNPIRRRSRYPLTTTPAERLADDGHRRRINGRVYYEVAVYPDKSTAQIKANFTRRELGKPARVFHTSRGWSVYVAYKGR